jgi:hypothetical protein
MVSDMDKTVLVTAHRERLNRLEFRFAAIGSETGKRCDANKLVSLH